MLTNKIRTTISSTAPAEAAPATMPTLAANVVAETEAVVMSIDGLVVADIEALLMSEVGSVMVLVLWSQNSPL